MMSICEKLQSLQPLYPIEGVIHVGVGGPHSIRFYDQLDVTSAIFIDANKQRSESLSNKFLDRPNWFSLCEVIGAKDNEQTYYEANNANESGLSPPDNLRSLWKNLQTKSQSPRRVIDLKTCLKKYEQQINIKSTNLLFIDCFPSLDILAGAAELLEKIDIVVLRAITDEDISSNIKGVSSSEIDKFLKDGGYVKYAAVPEYNSAICKLVYLKNYSFEIENLTKTKEKQQLRIDQLVGELSQDYAKNPKKLTNDEAIKGGEHFKSLGDIRGGQDENCDSEKITAEFENCISENDILDASDHILLNNKLNNVEKFYFCVELSNHFYKNKDAITSQHFVAEAKRYVTEDTGLVAEQNRIIMKLFLRLNKQGESLDQYINFSLSQSGLSENEIEHLLAFYNNLRQVEKKAKEHGHQLLLDYLAKNLSSRGDAAVTDKQVMIEIGTTRENVDGQGSTVKLGSFCAANNIKFYTVDMDPHNSRMAQKDLSKFSKDFEVVTMKGEEFLKNYKGKVEYAFLDAYDFDHGKHSKLRQSRYQKYLGSQIIERDCHLMHLECAKSLIHLISEDGVICIDDTWCDEEGEWEAKGKLAVPFLLDNGFEPLSISNNAVLLQRKLGDEYE